MINFATFVPDLRLIRLRSNWLPPEAELCTYYKFICRPDWTPEPRNG